MTPADRITLDECLVKMGELRTLVDRWTAVAVHMRDLHAANVADLDEAVSTTNSMAKELEGYNDFVMALSDEVDAHLGLRGPIH